MQHKGILEYEKAEGINKSHMVFVTGHMPDREGRKSPRLPDNAQALAQTRDAIHANLTRMNHENPISCLICGGTSGADLLSVEWALQNTVSVVLVLPFAKDDFFLNAVAYGNNKDLWSRIWSQAVNSDLVTIIEPKGENSKSAVEQRAKAFGDEYQHYTDVNRHLLSLLVGSEKMDVLAFWDGKGGDTVGGTQDAIAFAAQSGARCIIVTDGIENRAEEYPL